MKEGAEAEVEVGVGGVTLLLSKLKDKSNTLIQKKNFRIKLMRNTKILTLK